MSDLEPVESNRSLFAMKAIGAHARGDWEAERKALDAIHLLDRAKGEQRKVFCPGCEREEALLIYDGCDEVHQPVCNSRNGCGYGT